MSLSSSLWCFVHAAGQGFGKVMAHAMYTFQIIMTCLRWANIRQFCLSDGDICSVTLMYKKFIIDFNFDNCYANNLIKTRLSKCINGSLFEYRSRFSKKHDYIITRTSSYTEGQI